MNLRITLDGKTRALNEPERSLAVDLPYESGEKFTYKNLRTALEKAGVHPSFKFAGLSYPSERQKNEDKAKDPEAAILVKLPAWHELRLTLKRKGSKPNGKSIASDHHCSTILAGCSAFTKTTTKWRPLLAGCLCPTKPQ